MYNQTIINPKILYWPSTGNKAPLNILDLNILWVRPTLSQACPLNLSVHPTSQLFFIVFILNLDAALGSFQGKNHDESTL